LEARRVLLILDFQPIKLLQQSAVLQLQRLCCGLESCLALEEGVCTGPQGLVFSTQAAGGSRQVGVLGRQPRVDRRQLRRLRLREVPLLLRGSQVALQVLRAIGSGEGSMGVEASQRRRRRRPGSGGGNREFVERLSGLYSAI
jgi:hypothetical protein